MPTGDKLGCIDKATSEVRDVDAGQDSRIMGKVFQTWLLFIHKIVRLMTKHLAIGRSFRIWVSNTCVLEPRHGSTSSCFK